MSRIKNMSRGGWIVIGILVAMMLVPSGVAVAKALKYTGIEGTSTNKADVTPAGQLLTTEAQPSNLLGGSSSDTGNIDASTSGITTAVFTAPSNEAVVMDSLSLDVFYWDTSTGAGTNYSLYVGNSACSQAVGNWAIILNPVGFGTTEVPLTPGVAVPTGDALCSLAYATSNSYGVFATATGFLAPSASVSNEPLHAVPTLKPANG